MDWLGFVLGSILALCVQWWLISSAVRNGILLARDAVRREREDREAEKLRRAEAAHDRRRRAEWNAAHPAARWALFALKALAILAVAGGLAWAIISALRWY